METILLVEDNKIILNGLVFTLKQEGYIVLEARNVKEAEYMLEKAIDLVILDITLPDGSGFELCSKINISKKVPVIFLTAKDEEKDVVKGLELGAEDYVVKPFRTRELISRIKNVLRRHKQGGEKANIINVKNITINLDKSLVYKNGEEIELTALEYRILQMLLSNSGQIITRQQLLEKIWDAYGNFVNDNTLTVYIKRIREKIEDDVTKPEIIKTARGIGYRVGE